MLIRNVAGVAVDPVGEGIDVPVTPFVGRVVEVFVSRKAVPYEFLSVLLQYRVEPESIGNAQCIWATDGKYSVAAQDSSIFMKLQKQVIFRQVLDDMVGMDLCSATAWNEIQVEYVGDNLAFNVRVRDEINIDKASEILSAPADIKFVETLFQVFLQFCCGFLIVMRYFARGGWGCAEEIFDL